jgi:PST family polysaccharide transporter
VIGVLFLKSNQIFISQASKPLLVGFSLVRHDRPRLMRAYLKSQNSIVAASLPLLIGMCITAEPLILVFLGDQWSAAAPSLQWLSLSAIPYLFVGPVSPLGIALNKPSIFFKIAAIEFSFKLPLLILGLFRFDILDAKQVGICDARLFDAEKKRQRFAPC